MPIYKGSTEVTSGNLHKGSTEIQNGYKAADSFFVNETSLTITFTDNTPTGASMGTSSLVFNGTPGSSITQQVRTVSRAANYIIGTPVVTKTGDSNNDLNVATSLTGSTGFQNGLLTITGVLPSTNTTINLAVTCSSTAKITRTGSVVSYTLINNGQQLVTAQPYVITWSGGAPSTATAYISATSNGAGGGGFQASLVTNNVGGPTYNAVPPYTSVTASMGGNTGSAPHPGNGAGVSSGFGGAINYGGVTLGFNVAESATHKSFGTSTVIF